ncbi:Glycosyltransferase involved in cell wall bisynthesis [Brevibacterium sandarakinum]|uniref:D-inositol 3-phosphate glycosyltransferase n=1 Tax=Brevibacterium sandarakinum TaxID=629680 RepID=A0A1H1PRS1_BRESA|nr:glycosyltransferase family 4 protein [Brevibacterium sandarakinum]SDS14041.1 Glycosyltransferase involved in cell wall bisynthesis [Brevibacterium sandarakinum]
MRILLLSHYYYPEVGAPQRRWRILVDHLRAAGHQVITVAPHPHYPYPDRNGFFGSRVGRGRTRVDVRLGGTWDTGIDGERILRVPYLHSGSSMARQILDQTVSATGAMSAVVDRLRGRMRPDVIVSTTPALPFLLAGDSLSRILHVPHVAEVRDAWPDLISEMNLVTGALGKYLPKKLTGAVEHKLLPGLLTRAQRRAAVVVVTTEGFKRRLEERGVTAEVVRSGVSPAELAGASGLTATGAIPVISSSVENLSGVTVSKPATARAGLNLLYVGTVGRSQDLSTSIRAMASTEGVRLRIVGDGVDTSALQAVAAEHDVPVEFFSQHAGAGLAAHWEWADAGLVSLSPLESYEYTVPSKLYSLMARRIPVLGVVSGEAAEIVRSTAAGEVARPGDVASVAAAMTAMRERIEAGEKFGTAPASGQEPREWVLRHASAAAMGHGYERILTRAVS